MRVRVTLHLGELFFVAVLTPKTRSNHIKKYSARKIKIRKKESTIVDISREEACYMRKNGYADCVKQTHTRKIHYFLVEQPDKIAYDSKGKEVIIKRGALSELYHLRHDFIIKRKKF